KTGEEQERMTIAQVNALLYLGDHPREKLEQALRLKALPAGWRSSFEALLQSELAGTGVAGTGEAETTATGTRPAGTGEAGPGATGVGTGRAKGNAGLAPATAAHTAAPGFSPLRVARIDREAIDVISLALEPPDTRSSVSERSTVPTFQHSAAPDVSEGGNVPTGQRSNVAPLPGQFIVLRLRPEPGGPPLYRSYSLSGPPSSEQYRIGVKIEPHGAAGAYLSTRVEVGDAIDVSAPRGSFVLLEGDDPVVLVSAGIGVTPVLAMLHALVAAASPGEVWWLHGSRNRKSHPFAVEAGRLVSQLARGRSHIRYSKPDPEDKLSRDFDGVGRLEMAVLEQLGVPLAGDFYL